MMLRKKLILDVDLRRCKALVHEKSGRLNFYYFDVCNLRNELKGLPD
jgi:hypothetical protein